MQYVLRPARTVDIKILDLIHTNNMKGYVEKIYPWKPTLFRDNFTTEDYQIVEYQNQTIGFIKVVTSKTDVYLAEIQITNKYRNQGIGTNIISQIIRQAKLHQQRLWLKVIKRNPAINLYQRLGFIVYQSSPTHFKMKIDFRNT